MKKSDGGGPLDWLFLAMAYARLDEFPEARRALERAASWMRENPHPPYVELEAYRAEAEELLAIRTDSK